MTENAEMRVKEIFTVLKRGLGPFLLTRYKEAFGKRFEEEMKSATPYVRGLAFDDEEALHNSMDTQGWLYLIVNRKDLFRDDLGHIGLAYVSELLDCRNKFAHEQTLTDADIYRAADTVGRLLSLIESIEPAKQAYVIADELLHQRVEQIAQEEQSKNFSETIRRQMAFWERTIETLTKDQFQLIEWLRGHRRAAIAGCAGSGKTLVAAEKATRLARAGLRTLILCHNPNLADFLKHITSGVDVFDFCSWIGKLLGENSTEEESWTHYGEPSEEELGDAFDSLAALDRKYDAIIIDEGQDFRDTWWIIIEAAFTNSEYGILYIFHDDNQSLLPRRSNYPVNEAPFTLSKNCRNTGEVFEIVRKFHKQAPETSVFLAKKGVFQQLIFSPGEHLASVTEAIQTALDYHLTPNQLVVLTTETTLPEQSVLNKLIVYERAEAQWQQIVANYLYKPDLLSRLSESPYPTPQDIQTVVSASCFSYGTRYHRSKAKPKWVVRNKTLSLSIPSYLANNWEYMPFFASESWAEGIPKPRSVEIVANKDVAKTKNSSIPLYTVDAFKGLEADGIVLTVLSPREQLDSNLYVGLSRARLFLWLVVNSDVVLRIPQIR